MMGRLRQELDRLDLAKTTLVILLSDHGENLYDRYVDFRPIGHGYHLYDEMLRVPLILVGPGIPRDHVVGQQVRLIDVLPTITTLLRVPIQTWVEGRSLVEDLRGVGPETGIPDAVSEATAYGPSRISVRSRKLKYIYIPDLTPDPVRALGTWRRWDDLDRRELFDLEADPGETHNLAHERPKDVQRLQRVIDEHLARAAAFRRQHYSSTVSHDSELDERLQALGYLDQSETELSAHR